MKTRNLCLITAVGAGILLLGYPGTVRADQQFTFLNAGQSGVVDLSGKGVYAGRYQGQLGTGASAQTVNIFCVDFTNEISDGQTYLANTDHLLDDKAGPLSGSYYNGGLASALTGADYNPINLNVVSASSRASEIGFLTDSFLNANSFSGASGSTDVTTNFTGISTAIWDIAQDGGDGLSSGTITGDASTIGNYGGVVNYYEGLADSHTKYHSTTATWIQAPSIGNNDHPQEFAYEPAAVPEPSQTAALGIGILGLFGLAFRAHRRRVC